MYYAEVAKSLAAACRIKAIQRLNAAESFARTSGASVFISMAH